MGDDGTSFIDAAAIGAYADGTPGTNDMPGRLVFSTTADGASSPTERLRITSAGSLLVGTSSPFTSAARIHVDVASATLGAWVSSTATTSGRLHMRFENPNGVVGSISTSGTATSYNVSSDYRLKENVTAIQTVLSVLSSLIRHVSTSSLMLTRLSMAFLHTKLQRLCQKQLLAKKMRSMLTAILNIRASTRANLFLF